MTHSTGKKCTPSRMVEGRPQNKHFDRVKGAHRAPSGPHAVSLNWPLRYCLGTVFPLAPSFTSSQSSIHSQAAPAKVVLAAYTPVHDNPRPTRACSARG